MLEDNRQTSNGSLLSEGDEIPNKKQRMGRHPVDLELDVVLGKMPRKVKVIISRGPFCKVILVFTLPFLTLVVLSI